MSNLKSKSNFESESNSRPLFFFFLEGGHVFIQILTEIHLLKTVLVIPGSADSILLSQIGPKTFSLR